MARLESIGSPAELAGLSPEALDELAAEIRQFLVDKVSATGGHLGPNLGVVELSMALHRVFHSPDDVLLWDTGHQAYVHKILTGRVGDFDSLRQAGGLSGYPSRAESKHDVIENSHASTALSYADGIAKGFELSGELGRRHVVAVVGDGAMTGGMAWEAMNNIAASERQVIIVVNDNGRSYAPTIGGFARHLDTLRTTGGYEKFLSTVRRVLGKTPVVGKPAYETLHGLKKGVKDMVAPQGMFEDLGLKYVGPVDGHDIAEVERALSLAKQFPGPVIVHVITEKGRGYKPAELDDADRFHGVGVIDPETGLPVNQSAGETWTSTFSKELVTIGAHRPEVVAITAAMLAPTGLDRFAQAYPNRIYDVGIAEQHGATSAAGLAFTGKHPVFAVYATFLNRAFDQVLMDCALHKAGVTFVLDRAGVTGDDGASHNGMWDLSLLQIVPGVSVAAPRDGVRLAEELNEAVAIDDRPTVVRFPKGPLPAEVPAIERLGDEHGMDVLVREGEEEVLIVSVGAMAGLCVEVASRLVDQGIGVTVIDPRWVRPLPAELVALAARHQLVITVEDNTRGAGVGSAVSQLLRDHGVYVPARDMGVPSEFLDHGKRADLLAAAGLSPQTLARDIVEIKAKLDAATLDVL